MKTAEEIEQECYGISPQERVVKLQAWQLDAMKEGMRRAANILQKEINTCHGADQDDCMPCVARSNSKIDILTAAEQLTEKDL